MTNCFTADTDFLRHEVESCHGGNAKAIQSVPVVVRTAGRADTLLVVHVFRLCNHSAATRAYAWFVTEDPARRFKIVLHSRWVNSPTQAVLTTNHRTHCANDQ